MLPRDQSQQPKPTGRSSHRMGSRYSWEMGRHSGTSPIKNRNGMALGFSKYRQLFPFALFRVA